MEQTVRVVGRLDGSRRTRGPAGPRAARDLDADALDVVMTVDGINERMGGANRVLRCPILNHRGTGKAAPWVCMWCAFLLYRQSNPEWI